jgi:hypothetical protein
MAAPASRYLSSIAIEQQARELRAQVVRDAAVRAVRAFRSAIESFRESVQRSRAASRAGAQWFGAH